MGEVRGSRWPTSFFSKIWATSSGPHSPFIHILDDYSLLNIFYLSRLAFLGESEANNDEVLEGGGDWIREWWWLNLVQVCRRWRYIVLESASHLRLSLVCARGKLAADMLVHSPPLPLIIDTLDQNHDITAEDEEGMILALQHRDRVCRIRLRTSVSVLHKLVNALDGKYSLLESLYIMPWEHALPTEVINNMRLKLPSRFRAPHLRHLFLGSSLIIPKRNPVSQSRSPVPVLVYVRPNVLLEWLSLMPQLEALGISIYYQGRSIERLWADTPTVTRVTFPNLRRLGFQGASAYLGALLPQVAIPVLEKFKVYFFEQHTHSIRLLHQFMSTVGNLQLNTTTLISRYGYIHVMGYPHKGARTYNLCMSLDGTSLDWQVTCTAQFCHIFRKVFSAVEHLSLEYDWHFTPSIWNSEADRRQWRKLLGSFGSVKTLYVADELVGQLSRALQPFNEESPMELLPELQGLSYRARSPSFDAFINLRRRAGCPVTIVHL